MKKTLTTSPVPHSAVPAGNIATMQYYIKNTYEEAKSGITEGLCMFKEGLTETLDKTGNIINAFALPVNNFIKDLSQIEKEFEEERERNEGYCLCLAGQMVPAHEVLKLDMEENY